MNLIKGPLSVVFTRLHAHITEEDGAFTVRIRVHNHLKQEEHAWGEKTATTFDMASSMIDALASEFAIPQQSISIKIVMRRFKDGTFH